MVQFKRYIVVLLIGLAAIAIQGALLTMMVPEYLVPNLVLILVVFLGFYDVRLSTLFLVFLLGLQFDLASGVLIGPWAGAFVVVFLLLAFMAQSIFIESVVSVVISVFVASLVSDFIYFILIYEHKKVRILRRT